MIGFVEFIFVFSLILFTFGTEKLPYLGKVIGKGFAEFKKAYHEVNISNSFDVSIFEKYKSNNENKINDNTVDKIYKLANELNIDIKNKDINEVIDIIFDKFDNILNEDITKNNNLSH